MPYVIAVYDVESRRGARMLRLLRRSLHWVQNSVFEGELSESQLARLLRDAEAIMEESDSLLVYRLRDERYAERVVVGRTKGDRSRFL